MPLNPPNPALTNGDTITVLARTFAKGTRADSQQVDGEGTTYPAIVTAVPPAVRRDGELGHGETEGVQAWNVMIFWPTDPGVGVDQHLRRANGQVLSATAPSYPRGTGAWKVECESVN